MAYEGMPDFQALLRDKDITVFAPFQDLLKLAQEWSWSFVGYERVTKAHQNHDDVMGGQGVIAWIISADNPVELRVSVRPPENGCDSLAS